MQWDFWTSVTGIRAPGHMVDGRSRYPKIVAAHEWLFQPHLHVGERERSALLGEIPLQDRSGQAHTLTQRDADQLAGEDGDYHTRDLFEAIAGKKFPTWTLHMQIMPFDEAQAYRFNPFDLTKVWPHSDYPLIEVGR